MLGSCLIIAGSAGYGKSCLILLLFEAGDVILVPKHENRQGLLKEAKQLKEQGIIHVDITLKDIHVIADYFTDGKTLNEQLRS